MRISTAAVSFWLQIIVVVVIRIQSDHAYYDDK